MCIISASVESVGMTCIFVAPLDPNRQLTVYSNRVHLRDQYGTMILPFPVRHRDADDDNKEEEEVCQFIDLSQRKSLFSELEYLVNPGKRSKSARGQFLRTGFEQVGSYKATHVTLQDLLQPSEVHQAVFPLDRATVDFVVKHYSIGKDQPQAYEFVLCRLDQLKEYHPFGYVHDRLADGRLFVPTRHYHPSTSRAQAERPDWDHTLYVWNGTLAHHASDLFRDSTDRLATPFVLPCPLPRLAVLGKYQIRRHFPHNVDLLVDVC